MSGQRVRPILKRVFINEVEDRILKENMANFGTRKFSTYARRMLLFPTRPIIQVDLSKVEQMTYELNRIGNNINQLTKQANQSKEITVSQMLQIETLVKELSGQLTQQLELKIKEIKLQYGSD